MRRFPKVLSSLWIRSGIIAAMVVGLACGTEAGNPDDEDEEAGGGGKKSFVGEPAQVSVSLVNGTETGEFLLADITPDHFGVKIAYVSLRGTDPSGREIEPVIYFDEECPVQEVDVRVQNPDDPGEETVYPYTGIGSCSNPGEFTNLARDGDEVNADLNIQANPVPPGTYHTVVLANCTSTEVTAQWELKAGNMTEIVELQGGESHRGCATNGEIDLEIAAGDTVTVSVSYDLSRAASTQAAREPLGPECVLDPTDPSMEICSNGIQIDPTATKQ